VRLRFGPFTLDGEARLLLRDGLAVHLSPKAFDLLRTLVEHRPKVLEKSDLQSRIWPDTYVVDANLNVLVGEIRRAMGDDARQPRFVRTVHGVGYAFTGDAVDETSAPEPVRPVPCWLIAGERTFRLSDGENIVGRDPECQVWLDSPSVSRRHARIAVDGANRQASLIDLDSKNGTLLRGSPVAGRVELADGDEIAFGSVDATLHLWNADRAAETKRITRKRR
jgi:DNA-binding winged helix-turn-helix (wHTH) protein